MDENTQTIIVQVEPAPPSPENIQDYYDLFGLGILALLVVWGLKRVLALFTSDLDK